MDRSTRNEDFRRSIRYEETQNRSRSQRRITGKRTTHNKRYKGKIMALLLAGIITIGGCSAIKGQEDKTVKQSDISTISQMQEYNIAPQELGVSQEAYDAAIRLSKEIKEVDLSSLSDEELADYFDNLSDVQLKLVKEKISNLIGENIYDFGLEAPHYDTRGERNNTIIYSRELGLSGIKQRGNIIGHLKSDEMNDYMMDIADAQIHMGCLRNGTIKNRADAEKRLIEIDRNTEKMLTMNLLKVPTDKREFTSIDAYRFEEKSFVKNSNDNIQVAGREGVALREALAGREDLNEEAR